jgi:hypothetical protein
MDKSYILEEIKRMAESDASKDAIVRAFGSASARSTTNVAASRPHPTTRGAGRSALRPGVCQASEQPPATSHT